MIRIAEEDLKLGQDNLDTTFALKKQNTFPGNDVEGREGVILAGRVKVQRYIRKLFQYFTQFEIPIKNSHKTKCEHVR